MLDAAASLAAQSSLPADRVLLIDRSATYSHDDPNSAFPDNDFVDDLVEFLAPITRR